MIERWLLPGPARLVSDIIEDLMDGRQLLLQCVTFPYGLRQVVEDALQSRQRALRSIYDHEAEEPLTVLCRAASEGFNPAATIPSGVYWVDEIAPERVALWAKAVVELAERQRNCDPGDRAQVVAMVASGAATVAGLDVTERSVEVLTRLDLEVRALYSAAAFGGDPKNRVRAALAVELAQPLLPTTAALDGLEYWLGAPDTAFDSAEAIRTHAAAGAWKTPSRGEALLAMWRAQQSALLGLIDAERLRLVLQNRSLWRLPYTPTYADGSVGRRIDDAELLELAHLCMQASGRGIASRDPLRLRLDGLRAIRNALSHLEALSFGEIAQIFESADDR